MAAVSGGSWAQRVARARSAWHGAVDPPPAPQPVAVDPAVVELLRRLGAALLQAGQATNDVADTLDGIARAYGVPQVRFLVLPTAVFVR